MKVYLGDVKETANGWITVDPDPGGDADIRLDAAEFVRRYAGEVEEIVVGDLLTRPPGDAADLLRLLNHRLGTGALIRSETSGDETALLEVFRSAGLSDAAVTDPTSWESGAGRSSKSAVEARAAGIAPLRRAVAAAPSVPSDALMAGTATSPEGSAITAREILLHQLADLRSALAQEADRRTGLEKGFDDAARQLEEAREEIIALRATGAVLTTDEDIADPDSDKPAVLPGNAPIVPPPPVISPDDVPTTLRGRLRRAVGARLPEGSDRRQKAKAALDGYRETVEYMRTLRRLWRARTVQGAVHAGDMPAMTYDSWLAGHRIESGQVQAQRVWANGHAKYGPVTSIQLLVLPGPGSLGVTLASLSGQSWESWTAAVCVPPAEGAGSGDSRIRFVDPGGASEAAVANAQVNAAGADYVIVVRAGDVLEPDCLFTVASAVHRDPLLDLLVWDDDVRDAGGHRSGPRFRPSWSPEMLLGADYIGTACAIRRTAWQAVGGLDTTFGPSALWGLLLALDVSDEKVFRSSRVLSSVSRRPSPDPATAAKMVQHHLDARGLAATAELVDQVVRVNWNLVRSSLGHRRHPDPAQPGDAVHLSAVADAHRLPGVRRGHRRQRRLVGRQRRSGTTDHKGSLDLQVIWWTETPFNYSAVNNAGAAKGRGRRAGLPQRRHRTARRRVG